jgi:hypothetical protein
MNPSTITITDTIKTNTWISRFRRAATTSVEDGYNRAREVVEGKFCR